MGKFSLALFPKMRFYPSWYKFNLLLYEITNVELLCISFRQKYQFTVPKIQQEVVVTRAQKKGRTIS